jgi:hypothetical protein
MLLCGRRPWRESASNAVLAAILAADVAGYSRLTGVDEEVTIDTASSPTAAMTGSAVRSVMGYSCR